MKNRSPVTDFRCATHETFALFFATIDPFQSPVDYTLGPSGVAYLYDVRLIEVSGCIEDDSTGGMLVENRFQ